MRHGDFDQIQRIGQQSLLPFAQVPELLQKSLQSVLLAQVDKYLLQFLDHLMLQSAGVWQFGGEVLRFS